MPPPSSQELLALAAVRPEAAARPNVSPLRDAASPRPPTAPYVGRRIPNNERSTKLRKQMAARAAIEGLTESEFLAALLGCEEPVQPRKSAGKSLMLSIRNSAHVQRRLLEIEGQAIKDDASMADVLLRELERSFSRRLETSLDDFA